MFCDYTEHCNLSGSTMLKMQTVSALPICRHTYMGEDSVVFYFYCFEAARCYGDECQRMFINKYFSLGKEREVPSAL